MRVSLLLSVIVLSLSCTVYANIYAEPSATQKTIPNDEKTNIFVDLIMDTMNSIFHLVYDLQDNSRLEQWGNQIIQDSAQSTEDEINAQLGTTEDISKIKTEAEKDI